MKNFKLVRLLLCSFFAIVFSCFANNSVNAQEFTISTPDSKDSDKFVAGELIVKLKSDASIADIKQLNEQYKVYSVETLIKDLIPPEESLKNAKNELNKLETEHESWYWQLDKNSKEYLEYKAKLDKQKLELAERIKNLEALVVKNEARKKRAPAGMNEEDLNKILVLKTTKETNLEKMISDYKQNKVVVYAEPNYIFKINAVPTEDLTGLWHLKKIEANKAWASSQGENIVVAIVDTGVDYNHKELSSKMWVNSAEIPNNKKDDDGNSLVDDYKGWDCVNSDSDPMDDHYHGTHCAGIVGAAGNNGGIVGVAPQAKIMAVKGLSSSGAGTTASLSNGVTYASWMGADVISCSWGMQGNASTFKSVMDNAVSRGATVVVAAGNDNSNASLYTPASVPSVITVAATDSNDIKASFSNYGSKIDVAAPGVSIYSTVPGNVYRALDGTSMACPHVAGVAALVLAKEPTFNSEKVRTILKSSVDPVNTSAALGTGRINANKAVLNVSTATAKITAPLANAIVSGNVDVIGSTSANYELYYGQGASPSNWTKITSGGIVNNSSLGKFSTTSLTNGVYSLEVRVGTLTGKVTVTVDNNIMTGFPITIPVNYFWSSAIVDNIDSTPGVELIAVDVSNSIAQYTVYCYSASANGVSLKWKQNIDRPTGVAFTPIIYDLNKDGSKEVIIGGNVFTSSGTSLSGNWPLTTTKLGMTNVNGIAVGDFNADGKNEIAFLEKTSDETSPINLAVYDSNGNKIQINFSSSFCVGVSKLGLTAVDLDNNGKQELYFSAYKNSKSTIYKYDFSSNALSAAAEILTEERTGYPDSHGLSRPVVGDIDKDNSTEIVFPGNNYNYYVLGKNGIKNTVNYSYTSFWSNAGMSLGKVDSDDLVDIIHGTQNGAEVYFGNGTRKLLPLSGNLRGIGFSDGYGELVNGIAVADLNNDKKSELFFSSTASAIEGIHGYSWDGSQFVALSGFPKTGITSIGTPVITDVDGDGVVELIATSFVAPFVNGTIYAWKLNTPASSLKTEWPMFRHDPQQSGIYNLGTGSTNTPPVAQGQTVSTTKNTAKTIKLTGTDAENDALTFSVISNPQSGVLSGSAPNLTYTPNTGFVGTDSFTFKANDGKADSTAATVMINVTTAGNTAPVAYGQTLNTTKNTAKTIKLTATDADNDPLTYVVGTTQSGVLSGSAPNLTYTPNTGFVGTDSFTFKANDGKVDSTPATVTINVTNTANTAPVAYGQTATTTKNAAKSITLTATDADNDPLTFSVISNPQSGVLSGSAPNLTYTPNTGFVGTDSFTFKANDGKADSTAATVMINVTNAGNTAPVAYGQTATTTKNAAKSITLTATDADNDPLTFSVISNPQSGVLSGSAPNLTYTPNTGFVGTDTFTFKANDGKADSTAATVMINVTNAGNTAPVAYGQTLNTTKNTAKSIKLTGTDADNDPLTFAIGTPKSGLLSGTAPNLTYTPNTGFVGTDSFIFKVNDGKVDSTPATVTINVTDTTSNTPPVAQGQTISTTKNTTKSITLTATDADNDTLTFTVISTSQSGVLSGAAPNLKYIPNTGFVGTDSFTFKANDGNVDSAPATVIINVTDTTSNTPPVANSKSVTTQVDKMVSVDLTATDVDNDTLTLQLVSQPANGKIMVPFTTNSKTMTALSVNTVIAMSSTSKTVYYVPNSGFVGTDTFTFKANDGKADSAPATITVKVENPQNNTPPVAQSKSITTQVDKMVSFELTATDADNDPITLHPVTMPTNGRIMVAYTSNAKIGNLAGLTANSVIALSTASKTVFYLPNSGFVGTDSFTFKANDGKVDSAPATITIKVENVQVNTPPVAQSQNITTQVNKAININLAATDVDNDVLTIQPLTNPANGKLLVPISARSTVSKQVAYVPNTGFVGTDSFTFKANDGKADSAPATITIKVESAQNNTAPVAQSKQVNVSQGVSVNIVLTATDAEQNTLTYTVLSSVKNGVLSGTAPNLVYKSNQSFSGVDFLTFKANDGIVDSANTGVVVINVASITIPNNIPVATSETLAGSKDKPLTIVLKGSDLDRGDTLSYTVATNPASGKISGTAPNLTYTPNTGFVGTDKFTFKVSDGKDTSNPATITLDVKNSANNVPVAVSQQLGAYYQRPIKVKLFANDVDGDNLTYKVVTYPAHGKINCPAGSNVCDYDPVTLGSDSFTFVANDGVADSAPATISVLATLNIVNNRPIVYSKTLTTKSNQNINITIDAFDPESATLTYRIVNWPRLGALTGQAPNFVYTPKAGSKGVDVIGFVASDGVYTSFSATVSITVKD